MSPQRGRVLAKGERSVGVLYHCPVVGPFLCGWGTRARWPESTRARCPRSPRRLYIDM